MSWNALVHLGDLPLTLGAAAAISAWLVAARAWRMAFWWSLLFALAIGLVAASKIAFLAWGPALGATAFKAISGHATGVTAVAPTLLYLLLYRRGPRARALGAAAGMAAGAMMAALLVVQGQHLVAEALAGWMLGALASVSALRLAGALPPLRAPGALPCAALVFMTAACLVRPLPLGYLMFRTARYLARTATTLAWNANC